MWRVGMACLFLDVCGMLWVQSPVQKIDVNPIIIITTVHA